MGGRGRGSSVLITSTPFVKFSILHIKQILIVNL